MINVFEARVPATRLELRCLTQQPSLARTNLLDHQDVRPLSIGQARSRDELSSARDRALQSTCREKREIVEEWLSCLADCIACASSPCKTTRTNNKTINNKTTKNQRKQQQKKKKGKKKEKTTPKQINKRQKQKDVLLLTLCLKFCIPRKGPVTVKPSSQLALSLPDLQVIFFSMQYISNRRRG